MNFKKQQNKNKPNSMIQFSNSKKKNRKEIQQIKQESK